VSKVSGRPGSRAPKFHDVSEPRRQIPLASRGLGVKDPGRRELRAPKFRDAFGLLLPKFLDVVMPEHQSFLASHPTAPKFLALSCRVIQILLRADPRAPSDSDPFATFPTRRGPWEGPAKSRFAPGASRGGPGAASRALKAPGPCPGTPPAFRGQNPASAWPFCPLKPGWIREAPGGSGPSAGSWIGEGRVRPGILLLNFGLSEIPLPPKSPGKWPASGPASSAKPGLSPGKARPWIRRSPAKPRLPTRFQPGMARPLPPGPPPADPGF
jgi:hypothetical protein